MCDASGADSICGVPMEEIRAAIDAGDEFIIPFCQDEVTTILSLARTWRLHPGNIDQNLHPQNVSNVATEAAMAGTVFLAIQQAALPMREYITTQFELLIRAAVEFAYIHGAIIYRNGAYTWDENNLTMWKHRRSAIEQWLKGKGCPIGGHHICLTSHWLIAFTKQNPDGSRRYAKGGSGVISNETRIELLKLTEYLEKSYDRRDERAIRKSTRAIRRLLGDEPTGS
ncbi:hypothetical protein F5883DRAFT_559881 [Diaporthe sp. PMI_573]|nr:hypothetical protein F5883DRAFT_559881 [Diaporthaceae sp. PMI_573]